MISVVVPCQCDADQGWLKDLHDSGRGMIIYNDLIVQHLHAIYYILRRPSQPARERSSEVWR